MVVKHNLEALNANRMLGITTRRLNSSTEKLSSGYKINRAADDAAGLSISEKMRKQIRGLTQASSNAEDGISCVQTAEGALTEVTDMLQRMNELCVQSANGTNSVTDREYIQNELDQLITEIDRVAETTKFNEIYLLKGDVNEYHYTYTMDYIKTETPNTPAGIALGQPDNKYNYIGMNNLYFVDKTTVGAGGTAPMTAHTIAYGDDVTKYLNEDADDTNDAYQGFMNITLNTTVVAAAGTPDPDDDDLQYSAGNTSIVAARDLYVYDTDKDTITFVKKGELMISYLNDSKEMKQQYRLVEKLDHDRVADEYGTTFAWDATTIEIDKSKLKLYDADGKEVSAVKLNSYFDEKGLYKGGLFGTSMANAADEVKGTDIEDYVVTNTTKVAELLKFDLHVGADSNDENKIQTSLSNLSSAGLGINKLHSRSVGTVDENGQNATDSIDIIATAIRLVSEQRSNLGAIQNRLEHTILNLDNIVENTTRAESFIRDTDMATEMVQFANNSVLQQAGQSMLSQANQQKQGFLSLLQ